VKILLDTKVWLWMVGEPDGLGEAARELVRNPDTLLYVSAASAWEIAVNHAIGRLALPGPPDAWAPRRVTDTGVEGVPILHRHALAVGGLESLHCDPVDRPLVAQALQDGLTILTADPMIRQSPVATLPAD